jgi:probable F420-dependent oxidoreductase
MTFHRQNGGMSLVLGFGLPVSGAWAAPENIVAFARRAEDLGYGSLWTYQRLLAPGDSDWGFQYRSVLDPVVALAFAAAVTSRIRLGVAVVNAPFLPPAMLAKQFASLDVVSGGRLDAGLGLGWAPEEFAALGVPMEGRGDRLEEIVACLRALWGPDPVSFEGPHAHVPSARFQPKPVQPQGPPILLGATAEVALRRAGRIADGWISSSRFQLTELRSAVGTIREAAESAGRDPSALRFVVRGVVRLREDVRDPAGERRPLTGPADAVREDLAGLAEAGVTEVFLDLNFDARVGSPDADSAAALALADEVLETFAPDLS